jgi:hypothetical protein
MTRRSFRATPAAVAVQTASLLLVAGCVFAILISDIRRTRLGTPTAEAVPSVSPGQSQQFTDAVLAPEPR